MEKVEFTKLALPETARTYTYPDGGQVAIDGVTHIAVRPSGNHRLKTADGGLYIVSGGWRFIHIVAPDFSV